MICGNRNPENDDSNNKEESSSGRFGSQQKESQKEVAVGDRQDAVKAAFAISMCRSCKMCAKLFPVNCKFGITPAGKIVNAHVKGYRLLAPLLKAERRSFWFCQPRSIYPFFQLLAQDKAQGKG
jgi:hypothetical protein